jgi:hypothetical protein
MNSSGNSMDGAALHARHMFASQRAAFEADPYPLADRRREKIRALKRQISRYQDVLANAMRTLPAGMRGEMLICTAYSQVDRDSRPCESFRARRVL